MCGHIFLETKIIQTKMHPFAFLEKSRSILPPQMYSSLVTILSDSKLDEKAAFIKIMHFVYDIEILNDLVTFFSDPESKAMANFILEKMQKDLEASYTLLQLQYIHPREFY